MPRKLAFLIFVFVFFVFSVGSSFSVSSFSKSGATSGVGEEAAAGGAAAAAEAEAAEAEAEAEEATEASAGSRELRFVNKCNGTVWVGSQGSSEIRGGGWAVGPGREVAVEAPAGWRGRFWARTGCRFLGDGGATGRCETGDCGGRARCGGIGGEPPATLAEFSLGPPTDFYDVSLVDGYNVRVRIEPGPARRDRRRDRARPQERGTGRCERCGGARLDGIADGVNTGGPRPCQPAGCETDVNAVCPTPLRVMGRSRLGKKVVVACRSACNAFSQPRFCCTGAFGSPAACRPSRFSRAFKRACPRAYSFAFDDPSSLFTCASSPSLAYSVIFC